MLLLIDNYDSFTFNLAHYFEKLQQTVCVIRNDKISLAEIEKLNPAYIVISPGPGRPEDAGITIPCIEKFSGKIPILGVCLGHQAIAQAFGASIIHAKKVHHGKTSTISHNNTGVFRGIKNPLKVTRYHSLVIDRNTLPNDFIITAETIDDHEIMGIKHKHFLLEGVQFHPEAILTEEGLSLLENFLK
ncbi:MAG: aminodeoxychorismate/anthranilate synthase component II [Coxiellaceae bacterium]|nr:aminodeoxychorismate/anthranilate synthase component II [Coxiellaceae bacterium]